MVTAWCFYYCRDWLHVESVLIAKPLFDKLCLSYYMKSGIVASKATRTNLHKISFLFHVVINSSIVTPFLKLRFWYMLSSTILFFPTFYPRILSRLTQHVTRVVNYNQKTNSPLILNMKLYFWHFFPLFRPVMVISPWQSIFSLMKELRNPVKTRLLQNLLK